MIVRIPNLLTPETLTHLQQSLAKAEFIDGKLTAGWHAKLVKDNQQLAASSAKDLKGIFQAALRRNLLFQAAARPRSRFTRFCSAAMGRGWPMDGT